MPPIVLPVWRTGLVSADPLAGFMIESRRCGGITFPKRKGQIPLGEPTPRRDLNLQPGELVRVKSYQAILATLDAAGFNRGLFLDAENVPCCGKVYRVKTHVEKFIDEKTGKMRRLRTPAVILEGFLLPIAISW